MVKKNTDIQTLFLIRDESEYQSAAELIKLKHRTNYGMLTIKDECPCLVNDCAHLENVSRWQDYGVTDSKISRYRYWLNEYKTIEEIITAEMVKDEKYNNRIMQSQYFKFDLVSLLGQRYYDPINALNGFFLNNRPETICFEPADGFLSNLIFSFARLYEIECGRLVL